MNSSVFVQSANYGLDPGFKLNPETYINSDLTRSPIPPSPVYVFLSHIISYNREMYGAGVALLLIAWVILLLWIKSQYASLFSPRYENFKKSGRSSDFYNQGNQLKSKSLDTFGPITNMISQAYDIYEHFAK